MNDKTENMDGKFNWCGFVIGLIAGAALFYATIQLIAITMFSRTAA